MATVAICASYQPSDTGAAAVRLADLLSTWGLSVILCSTGQRRGNVSPRWDNRVCGSLLELLCVRHDLEIWLNPPRQQPFRNKLVPYFVVHNQNFPHVGAGYYAEASRIVCPDVVSHAILSDAKSETNTKHLPWDIGVPLHTPAVEHNTRLLLPLHYHYWRSIAPGLLKPGAWDVLVDFPDITLTVTTPSKLPQHLHKIAKRLLRRFPSQVQLQPVTDSTGEWSAFTKADLVLWPAEWDAFGTIPQLAIAAGAAVCTWDDADHLQIVGDDNRELLVPTIWPVTELSYAKFLGKLHRLLQDRGRLAELRQKLCKQASSRRAGFVTGWADLVREFV